MTRGRPIPAARRGAALGDPAWEALLRRGKLSLEQCPPERSVKTASWYRLPLQVPSPVDSESDVPNSGPWAPCTITCISRHLLAGRDRILPCRCPSRWAQQGSGPPFSLPGVSSGEGSSMVRLLSPRRKGKVGREKVLSLWAPICDPGESPCRHLSQLDRRDPRAPGKQGRCLLFLDTTWKRLDIFSTEVFTLNSVS